MSFQLNAKIVYDIENLSLHDRHNCRTKCVEVSPYSSMPAVLSFSSLVKRKQCSTPDEASFLICSNNFEVGRQNFKRSRALLVHDLLVSHGGISDDDSAKIDDTSRCNDLSCLNSVANLLSEELSKSSFFEDIFIMETERIIA
jgi:hypothetical protein